MTFVIAVDGSAASGKGTIAAALAEQFTLPYLDTGLLYRAVALAVTAAGSTVEDPDAASWAAAEVDLARLEAPELRSLEIGELASRVAAHPGVRAALLERQQAFSRQDPGAVLDGRDIGTVVAPDAAAKLFVDAAVEIRAERRWRQSGSLGGADGLRRLIQDLRLRDERDRNRSAAPLVKAQDAVLLDTSELSIAQAVDAARRIVEAARARWLLRQPNG